jgi:hypothetical protein
LDKSLDERVKVLSEPQALFVNPRSPITNKPIAENKSRPLTPWEKICENM